eukprot:6630395-Prymnesium_polylepis.1
MEFDVHRSQPPIGVHEALEDRSPRRQRRVAAGVSLGGQRFRGPIEGSVDAQLRLAKRPAPGWQCGAQLRLDCLTNQTGGSTRDGVLVEDEVFIGRPGDRDPVIVPVLMQAEVVGAAVAEHLHMVCRRCRSRTAARSHVAMHKVVRGDDAAMRALRGDLLAKEQLIRDVDPLDTRQ